ncbi:glycoside hydrolase family 131 protein [Aspergillus saccharolyticus JOP 1030-1]|uniref:Glycoside hydrolase 131 catalytic N-terminal domain-containing protein n=1 Tax=Aspergillus saccharolyticus JOP 1030-1 TaxID=1450539 RepID=A0A318ZQ07_9EURO|nr:hypothetical protein BP01DRAFT_420480 [Aspergillus saccharolyticus JOP 1030-1]PYH48705.1 hypothetical protein BP01DRAFT_420480 [Aspergillus saccharolyticus JOP 1030-1]
MKSFVSLLAFPASSLAGTVLWSGIFNSSATVADFDDWSWSNQIEPWQWYIYGTGNTSEYLGLSTDFKNPADTSDAQGLRISIDGTSFWEGQTMERSELIPQTTADLGSGHLYYHFSLSTKTTNAPNASFEHQIAFFESHFTELQYGLASGASGSSDNTLRWNAGGETQWSVQLEAGNWYNFAYDIDFDAQTVGLWASNGSDPLTEVVSPVSASASSNSADWHVGELRLPNGGSNDAAEDWYWSGIYIEEAPITKEIGSGSSSSSSSSSADASSAASSVSSTSSSTSALPESTAEASSTSTTASAATTVTSTTAAVQTTAATVAPSVASSVTTSSVSTAAAAVTSAVAPSATIEVASTATASAAVLPTPTTATEVLDDIRALFSALISRSSGNHARDFARRG